MKLLTGLIARLNVNIFEQVDLWELRTLLFGPNFTPSVRVIKALSKHSS